MATIIKVLFIEDNRIEARRAQHWLASAKDTVFEVECVDHLQAGVNRLSHEGIDIVLLDLNLPDSRGIETFFKLHDQVPEIPIVVLTGECDERVGPLAVEKGAQDYLLKSQANGALLAHVLRYALGRHRAQLEQLATECHRQQAEMAREVQLRMLPRIRPAVPGYDFWDYYKAAESIGGDYFGYLQLPDQRIAMSIGDVCGKGISAALTMAELCSEVRHSLETSCNANVTMSRLNRHFCERSLFVTFALCILDILEHTVTVASAGHMPPLRRTEAANHVESLPLLSYGLPLGIRPDEVYLAEVFAVQPGDLFLLYTDGITEACGVSKDLYGQHNLMESLRRSPANVEEVVQRVIRDVNKYRGTEMQSDDMCVVGFARSGGMKRQFPQVMSEVTSRIKVKNLGEA